MPALPKHVALLRGINLADKNRLSMNDLTEMFSEAGCEHVTTYLQSGNVLFHAPRSLVEALPSVIAEDIAKRFSFRVPVVTRSSAEMERVVDSSPFPCDNLPPQSLHVCFLANKPTLAGIQSLDPARSAPDVFHVINREIYLHLPNGMARTKLTSAYFDSRLKIVGTVRNWNTVTQLRDLLRQ